MGASFRLTLPLVRGRKLGNSPLSLEPPKRKLLTVESAASQEISGEADDPDIAPDADDGDDPAAPDATSAPSDMDTTAAAEDSSGLRPSDSSGNGAGSSADALYTDTGDQKQ